MFCFGLFFHFFSLFITASSFLSSISLSYFLPPFLYVLCEASAFKVGTGREMPIFYLMERC